MASSVNKWRYWPEPDQPLPEPGAARQREREKTGEPRPERERPAETQTVRREADRPGPADILHRSHTDRRGAGEPDTGRAAQAALQHWVSPDWSWREPADPDLGH